MGRLFGRTLRLRIGDVGLETPAPVGALNARGGLIVGLRVSFKVRVSLDSKCNTAEVQIYNLSESTRSRIESAVDRPESKLPNCTLEVGYPDTRAAIFVGTMRKASSDFLSPGWVTKVQANDGEKESKPVVNRALAPQATVKDALLEVGRVMGMDTTRLQLEAASAFSSIGSRQFGSGLSMFDSAHALLDRFARTYGFDWTVTQGRLRILLPGEVQPNVDIPMSSETGLIGRPSRIIDPKRPKSFLVEFRHLIDPRAQPGIGVRLETDTLPGRYRCLDISHEGDTHGAEWYSKIEAERRAT